MRYVMFYLQLLTIILVSSVDIMYTLETKETILDREQNPVAHYLIETYDPYNFVSVKAAMTCLVVLIFQAAFYNIKRKHMRFLWAILAGVTLFQIWLLCWLHMPASYWYVFYNFCRI